MSRYAKGTTVTSDRSRAEIERVLLRYGASRFGYAMGAAEAQIAFVLRGRAVRVKLKLPNSQSFTKTERGKPRAFEAAHRDWETACRQAWRCLLLVIKAKLEAEESGISTFEDEWLAYLVTGDGKTIGERLAPQIEAACTGKAPLMLGVDP